MLLSLTGQATASPIPPIWETNFGNPVAFAPNADDGTVVINFGFAFPFLGNTYTSGSLSSNGFLWLNPANADAGLAGDVSSFLSGDPRIAGGWVDLVTSNVDFNTFGGNRAVITYAGAEEFGGNSTPYSFQMQLFSTGRIVFGYNSFETPATFNNILIGVTPGGSAADPGSSDLLNATPFLTAGGTVYQFIPTNGIGGTFEGSNIIFDPNGAGWNVTAQPTVTTTPEPGTLGLLGMGVTAFVGIVRRRRMRRPTHVT